MTQKALKEAGFASRVISTDTNVECMLNQQDKMSPSDVTIGTEVVESGKSIVANQNYILYYDCDSQSIRVYLPSLRDETGNFPNKKIMAQIVYEQNPALVRFVRTFQTPLNITI